MLSFTIFIDKNECIDEEKKKNNREKKPKTKRNWHHTDR